VPGSFALALSLSREHPSRLYSFFGLDIKISFGDRPYVIRRHDDQSRLGAAGRGDVPALAIFAPPASLHSISPETELAHLRQELATLRKQMDGLLRFITIETDEETKEPCGVNLRCGVVMFQSPHAPLTSQMFMDGSANGPFLSFCESTARGAILSMEEDVPTVTLYTA
jgi:hypothetical protein